MHDALLMAGFLTSGEAGQRGGGAANEWVPMLDQLETTGRVKRVAVQDKNLFLWVATERTGEILRVHPEALVRPEQPEIPASPLERDEAIREMVRGRLEIVGPTTADELAQSLSVGADDATIALAQLEGEGVVLRGSFTPSGATAPAPLPRRPAAPLEWCDRRLLARIHRYTLNRLRAEIAPVNAAEYMRFLLSWQRVDPERRMRGLEGLAAVIGQLDGYECPAASWESDVLASRCDDYDPMLLDTLCLTGRVMWGRLDGKGSSGESGRPIRSTPIGLFLRPNAETWLALGKRTEQEEGLSTYAREVLVVLRRRGASFFHDLVQGSELLNTQVETALGELAAAGLVTSDSFAGLRALLVRSDKRKPFGSSTRRHRMASSGVESAGRWSLLSHPDGLPEDEAIEVAAWTFLRRYGVVFRRVLHRESLTLPWRKLAMFYRRLEARGEIRGGRFVQGMSGEQFALPEAVSALRAVRKEGPRGQLLSISAADPLNLVGIVTPSERVPALRKNRIVFGDGVPLASLEGGVVRQLGEFGQYSSYEVERALVRRKTALRIPEEKASGTAG
jgi:ATP-dependent Lhr-like helicase